jgi:hypothetical protein
MCTALCLLFTVVLCIVVFDFLYALMFDFSHFPLQSTSAHHHHTGGDQVALIHLAQQPVVLISQPTEMPAFLYSLIPKVCKSHAVMFVVFWSCHALDVGL